MKKINYNYYYLNAVIFKLKRGIWKAVRLALPAGVIFKPENPADKSFRVTIMFSTGIHENTCIICF